MAKQGEQYQVIMEVKEIKGRCPNHKVGDTIVINRQTIPLDMMNCSGGSFCYHALAGLYGQVMLVRGGVSERVTAQCLDPGPDYAEDAGTVIFEIRRGDEVIY